MKVLSVKKDQSSIRVQSVNGMSLFVEEWMIKRAEVTDCSAGKNPNKV
ncbi:hypothetical protein [Marinifilum sp. N1E240]|nr:hypothetical protein [Marinifilum sp. N1E240]